MGEVYRARDTRLGRDVAIKALPAEFAHDPDRLARFEREAKLLASLSHANIAGIYGLELVDEHRYLALEYIEGETLADRIARGPLPVPEAIEVCAAVAAALESAHESGIVHRDLKPGNIMLTPAGAVKVLDFGLAKAGGGGAPGADAGLSASPTMTYGYIGTQAGMVLGTAAYMSPEQARGKAVDKRSDIWSFGCVLFECLTGKVAFEGETVSDLIADILTGDPDWDSLPAATPPRVRELLRRCLEKDVRRRLRDMGDARIELEDTLSPRGTTSSAAVSASIAAGVDAGIAATKPAKKSAGVGLPLFAAIAGALVALLAIRVIAPMVGGGKTAEHAPVRFRITEEPTRLLFPDGTRYMLSPDGTTLAVVGADTNEVRLWIQPLDSFTPRQLTGTEGVEMPFWSPDGKYVGFFAKGKLKRVLAAGGGDPEDLCDVKRARGGTWNAKDQIVFAPTSDGPLSLVSANGGEPRVITTIDSTHGETGHRFPMFLPDGKHFLYSSLPPQSGKFGIFVGSIDGGKPKRLLGASSGAVYAAPGYLLFLNGLALMAQRFDAGSLKLSGEPISLRDAVNPTNYSGAPGFSAARSRVLAYPTFQVTNSRFAWFDTQGHELAPVPLEPAQYLGGVDISPDGKHVVYVRAEGTDLPVIWLGDLERGVAARFSQEPGNNESPQWSYDGTHIAYQNSELGPQHFVVRSVSGAEPAREYLVSDPAFKSLDSWRPDGKALIFSRQAAATKWDIYTLPLEGDAKPIPFLNGPFNEQAGAVSPDGRWISYTSDETGRTELYVQSYPTPGTRYQVTSGGGGQGGWPPDGKRMTFGVTSQPFVVQVADVIPGPEFRLGPARALLRVPDTVRGGDLTPDGKRALLLVPAGKPPANTVTVVLDWVQALRKR
jgi:Tol biopolymer transport system component